DTDINFTNPTHAIVTVSQVTITGLSNNTSYFWKVRSSDGAIYSPYSAIWSFTTETGVGIEENETNILLYPNPANENATLQFGNAAERTIRVISPTGQVVREISTNEAHFNLDLSGMNSGLYMVIIVESKEMKTLRLTIE
ncbi:MAG TPA: T9SS type A sorting domain-containing protein, partial [Bacteroidales bacterium]|nr:T9SS type A sorting domain-containing protein [Bacteroidales bacterium]